MSLRHVQFTVRGTVQGVNFRAWAADRAKAHGVSGWIRNGDDGSSVTGQAIGDQSSVGSFVKDLHDGPKPAKVESVELVADENVESTKDAGVDQEGFEVRK